MGMLRASDDFREELGYRELNGMEMTSLQRIRQLCRSCGEQNVRQFVVLLRDHRLKEHFDRERGKEDLFLSI